MLSFDNKYLLIAFIKSVSPFNLYRKTNYYFIYSVCFYVRCIKGLKTITALRNVLILFEVTEKTDSFLKNSIFKA